eukprot:UN01024
MALSDEINLRFFDGNLSHIADADSRWVDWFGSLNEGVLNFLCLTGTPGMDECGASGQPKAPATNSSNEIYRILKQNQISPFLQSLKGV